jgi:hypothetical protein
MAMVAVANPGSCFTGIGRSKRKATAPGWGCSYLNANGKKFSAASVASMLGA